MSARIIEIGTIIEDYYDCEDSEKVAALKAHWESIDPRGRHPRWQVVANPPEPEPEEMPEYIDPLNAVKAQVELNTANIEFIALMSDVELE